ncbi:MAG: FkbM family methyltransferase [Vicinamibacterales bacterium]
MPVPSDTRLPAPLFPAGLHPGERYVLDALADEATTASVAGLLQWASPAAVQVHAAIEGAADATVVLCGPDGLARAAQLADGGIPLGRLRYMPLPVGYPWAFWETWQLFGTRRDLWHCLPAFEAYRHFVVTSPYLGGEANASITRWDGLRDASLYWTSARPHFEAHARELAEVRAGLSDDASRATLDLVLASEPRALWHHYLRTIVSTTDYLDDDVPRPGEHVLNLGVFTGHELPYFSLVMGESGVVHCIDPVGLDLLSPYARAHIAGVSARVVEARFAASATRGTASFRSYPDGQVCFDEGTGAPSRTFPTATIDDYVEQAGIPSVAFIKIDIEGMEFDALAGMQQTLARHRPTLSLAVYHEADHLWRLPLQLMRSLRDYRFFLSHTSPARWETVLTAVPVERPGRGIRSK